jgi:hypothetical protein
MKIRFTEVVTQEVGGVYEGISAAYEATDSDGFGHVGLDSGALAAPQTGAPVYPDLATVEALTQSEIYNDFYDTTVIVTGPQDAEIAIDSINTYGVLGLGVSLSGLVDSEVVGETWLSDLQEELDLQIEIAKVESGAVVIESVDNITDQTPIDI